MGIWMNEYKYIAENLRMTRQLDGKIKLFIGKIALCYTVSDFQPQEDKRSV